jgi:hypothetical protein
MTCCQVVIALSMAVSELSALVSGMMEVIHLCMLY